MRKRFIRLLRTRLLQLKGMRALPGSRVFHGVEITHPRNVRLGHDAVLYQHASVLTGTRGQFRMGNNSHLSSYVYLLIQDNTLDIGDHVAVGPFTAMFCHSHDIQDTSQAFANSYMDADIHIGSNVFIGSHCIILPGTRIDDHVVLAANSVASGHLVSGYLYAGSPARQVKAL
ncbi:MAG: acyltransferase [Lentimicrobiaceae bacterium]|nr:acyltransferase [Lentimicrobiaceae bacterium]